MKLPVYYVVGTTPVKAIPTEEEGMDVLRYDLETREFVRDLNQTPVIVFGLGEFTRVSEADFNAYVADLNRGSEPRWYEEFKSID